MAGLILYLQFLCMLPMFYCTYLSLQSVVSGACDPDTITLMRLRQKQRGRHTTSEKCTENFHNGFIMGSTNNKWWTNVTIGEKVLGAKRTKIICSEVGKENLDGKATQTENPTVEISMADQESQQFCLDEETAIKLGIVAAEIELFMGHHKPVDIEWAIDQVQGMQKPNILDMTQQEGRILITWRREREGKGKMVM